MTDLPDAELLEQFVRDHSETAFAALVERHIGLVHSVTLRHTTNPQHAQDITQVVFIILARKAATLNRKTILAGWLYHTARLVAANFQRAETRRIRREQEVFMQSKLHESAPDPLWTELSPLLDEAMSRLRSSDRDALVLRYFQNKSLAEVGLVMGLAERTAQKRIFRAIEKLRTYFAKRGVTDTADEIAKSITANSVQAVSPALAKAVAAAAFAKGTTASTSILTLTKGALKIMAWTKAKTAVVAGIATVAIIGTTTSTIILTKGNPNQQRLKDGSVLSISQVSFGDSHNIVINGKTNHWGWPGHPELVLMLKLSGKSAASNPLVKPPFYRPMRCMIHGDSGIEFAAEIAPQGFKKYGGEYYGEIQTDILPRDSHYLWLRFEQSPTNRPYGPWQTVAEFKIPSPVPATNYNWTASATPATNRVEGMDFVLSEVTLKTNANDERDIWNHKVTIVTEAWANGVRLTNWAPAYIQAGDASGNSAANFQMHRSLDPRFVWKLGMDFEMASNYPPENVFTIPLRRTGNASFTTNVMDVPVTISWNGQWVDAEMPTNRSDLALRFVRVEDRNGSAGSMGSGSWSQFGFREGYFYAVKNGVYSEMGQPATVTFAVVPNIHTIFYVQPKLATE